MPESRAKARRGASRLRILLSQRLSRNSRVSLLCIYDKCIGRRRCVYIYIYTIYIAVWRASQAFDAQCNFCGNKARLSNQTVKSASERCFMSHARPYNKNTRAAVLVLVLEYFATQTHSLSLLIVVVVLTAKCTLYVIFVKNFTRDTMRQEFLFYARGR